MKVKSDDVGVLKSGARNQTGVAKLASVKKWMLVTMFLVAGIVIFSGYWQPWQIRNGLSWTSGRITENAVPMFSSENGGTTGGGTEKAISNFSSENDGSTVIRITSWTYKYFLGQPWWTDPFSKCSLPKGVRCTYDHTQKDPLASDVILFRALMIKTMPRTRKPSQKYFFFETESQAYQILDWSKFNNIFNASVSFLKDSDVKYPYGFCEEIPTEGGYDPRKNYAEGKFKLAAWLVSNCKPLSHRDQYVRELEKHIPIDVYGKCGSLECDGKMSDKCETVLQRDYKFYLAFENAFCKDYATEKLFRSFRLGIVPVVLGYMDYENILPPHSFINIKDFKSPQKLAEYLKLIDSNDTLYNEYFRWRGTHRCQEYVKSNLPCDICEYAHRTKDQSSILDLGKFWNHTKDCVSADIFRQNCDCWP